MLFSYSTLLMAFASYCVSSASTSYSSWYSGGRMSLTSTALSASGPTPGCQTSATQPPPKTTGAPWHPSGAGSSKDMPPPSRSTLFTLSVLLILAAPKGCATTWTASPSFGSAPPPSS